MNFIIRQATTSDNQTIYNLIETAFQTADHCDGNEQDFAVNLGNGEYYIPELELVAEAEGKLIGHIMFTKTYVTKADGTKYGTLMVAPLSVLIKARNMGVGSSLMKEGLCLAAQMGYETAFLCGDPDYYQRLGYKTAHTYDINHDSIPQEYVMVYEMIQGSLNGISGVIRLE